MFKSPIAFIALILLALCTTMSEVPSAARSELAPTGQLRAAINFGNPILATKDPSTGEPRGVSVDLSRELARRLGVPVQFVTYDAAGKVVEGLSPAPGTSRMSRSIRRARSTSATPHLTC